MSDRKAPETLEAAAARERLDADDAARAAARAKPNLVLVESKSGEVATPQDAADEIARLTGELADTTHKLDELNRKYLGLLSQLGNLRADKTTQAKEHSLWGKAVALWAEYKIATGPNRPSGENRARWSADRFWLCEPYLREDGFLVCRYAVWGIGVHPNRKQITAEYAEVYDSWELLFRNRGTFERYANRGRAVLGDYLEADENDTGTKEGGSDA